MEKDELNKDYEDWYIVFAKSDVRHWVFRFLDPCFQHCYAVKESPGGQFWIIVNSRSTYTDITIKPKLDFPHIRLLCPDDVILPIRAKINADSYKWHFGLNTCVDVCKGVIGLNNWRIFTPYQLYRWINGHQTFVNR